MPGRLRERVADVTESMVAVPGSDTPVEPELLIGLGHAVRGTEQVRLEYRDRTGRDTERRVEPYRIVVLGRRAGAGICCPTTSTARIGAPSASTASGPCTAAVGASRPAPTCPIRPRTCSTR